jgi:hypothetical protein
VSKSSIALIGAGVCSLSLAALVVAVAEPTLLKAPTTLSKTTHFEGAASSIDPATGRTVQGTLRVVQVTGTHKNAQGSKVRADGGGDTAVYSTVGTSTFTPTGGTGMVLSQDTTTYPFDRGTGQLTGKDYGDNTVLRKDTHGIKLPFNTKKQDYRWYDQSTASVQTMHYTGTKTIKGLKTYEFTYTAPPTDMGLLPGIQAVPGAWVGHPEASILPADQWVETTQHLYVDPTTGGPVSIDISEHAYAQVVASAKTGAGARLDLLEVDHLRIIDADVASLVANSKSDGSKVRMLQKAPWALGALGLLLLGGGLFRTLRRRDEQQPVTGPDVSGILPTPRDEPALDPSRVKQ